MESGTIIRWFAEEGEAVEAGQMLLEIQTDKVNIEIEAEAGGILLKKVYVHDDEVPVQEVIGYIGKEGEEIPAGKTAESNQTISSGTSEGSPVMPDLTKEQIDIDERSIRRTPAARHEAQKQHVSLRDVFGSGPEGRIHLQDVQDYVLQQQSSVPRVTPLANKIAQDHAIALDEVSGSGVQGKVKKQDVQDYMQKGSRIDAIPSLDQLISSTESVEEVKVEGMRKIIGERMVQSVQSAPHVTLVSEVDMSEIIRLRKALLPIIEQRTVYRLSYTEIILKSVAMSLREHPDVNASLQDNVIRRYTDVHVGLAVAVENGLYVPVVRHADRKGLCELTTICKTLAQAAREGKLTNEQISGGTFTISNLGMYAVDAFTPIINQPESAILGLGRITEKPVGIEGNVVLRPIMSLSLSFDHRVMDGVPAAAFLTALKQKLEQPFQLLI